ncbi:MAG: hypothetical protein RSE16_03565 [Sphingobium sp.]|nr:MAG: hypothetical protein RSE16_03565 [Sphingobium sp.]
MKIVDVSLLSFGGNVSHLAIFNLALQIPSVSLRILDPIRPILQRKFVEEDFDIRSFKIAYYSLLTMSFLISSSLIILGPEINILLYAGKLDGSTDVSWLLSIWLVPSGANLLMATALIARGHGRIVLYFAAAQIFVMIAGAYFLVPCLGAKGAAAAMLATAILGAGLSGTALKLYMEVDMKNPMILGISACGVLFTLCFAMTIWAPALSFRIVVLSVLTVCIVLAFATTLRSLVRR